LLSYYPRSYRCIAILDNYRIIDPTTVVNIGRWKTCKRFQQFRSASINSDLRDFYYSYCEDLCLFGVDVKVFNLEYDWMFGMMKGYKVTSSSLASLL